MIERIGNDEEAAATRRKSAMDAWAALLAQPIPTQAVVIQPPIAICNTPAVDADRRPLSAHRRVRDHHADVESFDAATDASDAPPSGVAHSRVASAIVTNADEAARGNRQEHAYGELQRRVWDEL